MPQPTPAKRLTTLPPDRRATLVMQKARATRSGSIEEIRDADQALNAARIEQAITTAFETEHGISDKDRERLCSLLHSRGGDVDDTP